MAENESEYSISQKDLDLLGKLAMGHLRQVRDETHVLVEGMKIPHIDVGAIVIPFVVMEDARRVYTFMGSSTELAQTLALLRLEVKRLEEHLARTAEGTDA